VINRRITAVALAVVMLLASAGCSQLNKIRQAQSGIGDISQWTAEKMTQAFTAINAKIGANPADYEDVIINELFVRVNAIDPHKRENVDQYTYQGGSVEVAPVDISQNAPGAIETAAFKGDTVKPEVLAQAMSSAPKDSGIVEKPAIEFVMVKKMGFKINATLIWVYVKGPRDKKTVYYDLTGALTKGP
jgi:hypothetical protein